MLPLRFILARPLQNCLGICSCRCLPCCPRSYSWVCAKLRLPIPVRNQNQSSKNKTKILGAVFLFHWKKPLFFFTKSEKVQIKWGKKQSICSQPSTQKKRSSSGRAEPEQVEALSSKKGEIGFVYKSVSWQEVGFTGSSQDSHTEWECIHNLS